jgi:hypothetical protein
MKKSGKLLALVVLLYSVFFVFIDKAVPREKSDKPEVKLQQLALFKNGLGFFVSEVTIPENKKSFVFVPFAVASHGTFWISYPPDVKLKDCIARQMDSEESLQAITIPELLRANIGRSVKLYLTGEPEPVVEGKVKSCPEGREIPASDPYTSVRRFSSDGNYNQPMQLVMMETSEGPVALVPNTIKRVEFPDKDVKDSFAAKIKSMQLEVNLVKPVGGRKLTVSYLAKGVTWAPSYIVDITNEEKATLSAKAIVINEACDINNVIIQLVTGFPNLQFSDVISPLAMKENLAQFLQSLARRYSWRADAGMSGNVMTQQVQRGGRRLEVGEYEDAIMPKYETPEAGKVAEDLFFYPVENVNLAKGQVGYFPLFTESVPYKHIYKWEIPDYINYDGYYDQLPQRQKLDEEVWHCLKMENVTKIPWTTAPAEIIKDGLILGQDTLKYTPPKVNNTLRITRASNIKAEQVELEIERKRDVIQLYDRHYDLVTVEGKLSVTNFQEKAITLEITKTLSGDVKSSQPQAKIETKAQQLLRMNKNAELTWTVELGPNEQKHLSYIYDMYVRR